MILRFDVDILDDLKIDNFIIFFIVQQTVSIVFLTIYTKPSLFLNLFFIPFVADTYASS